MQERGVIYYNIGTSCAVRLLVSLTSLRRHYLGPVTILSEGEGSHRLCEKIAKVTNAEFKDWDSGVRTGKNHHFLAKTRYHLGTPYEVTVALDSDTVVVGSIDELFNEGSVAGFCVSQFAKWTTCGRIISRRIRGWDKITPTDIGPALRFGPAINTGVMAFRRDATLFADWYSLTIRHQESFIPDEIACQILLYRHPHRVIDACWNRSCKHDNPNALDTRIIHFHGRKHCRAGLPYGAQRWVCTYDEIWEANLADIQKWTPAGDRVLARHINSTSVVRHKS